MIMKTTTSKSRGHSLVEMVTAIGVIAVVAGICLTLVGRFKENSDAQKLEGDLATLNRAADVYLANGGAFETSTDVDSMLAKLKTYPLSTQRQTIVGLRGPMVDMRVKAVPMTAAEEATSRPRAIWRTDSSRLMLVNSGPGIKEFVLGTVPPIIEEVRNSTVEYASVSDWVWDYGTDGTNDRPDYGGDVTTNEETPYTSLGGGGGGGGGSFNPETYRIDLSPPLMSLPGGFYEYLNFPLVVTLVNPNEDGTSQILYKIGNTSWEIYNGGNLVIPSDYSTTLQAYCSSADPDFWNDSETAEEVYETLYISGSSDGAFTAPTGDPDLVYTIEDTEQGSIFTWGTPSDGFQPSSLHFEGTSFSNISPELEFAIGNLTFHNGTILAGTGATGVELALNLDLTVNIPIATQNVTFTFELINTPNYDWQSNNENADYVQISTPSEMFTTTYNGVIYYIDLSFGAVGGNGFSTIDEFHVWENQEASATVIAKITTTPPTEFDTVPPTVELWTASNLVSGQFEVLCTFNEQVNGFVASDLQVTNATVSSFTGNGIDYSFFVNPLADGLVTIRVPAAVVVDANANANTESNPLEVIADLTPPQAQLAHTQLASPFKNNNGHGNNLDGVDSSNPGTGLGGPNGGEDPSLTTANPDDEVKGSGLNPYPVTGPITVDVDFNEPVTGLAYEDFIVSGATLSNLQGSGSVYSLVVTPTVDSSMATLALSSGAVSDGVGNGSIVSDTMYMTIDGNGPTAQLSTISISVEGSFIVDAVFSAKCWGFFIDDLHVSNGVVSDFSAQGNQRNFSFRVTPQSVGAVTVSIPASSFSDDALNPNVASNTLDVTYTATSYVNFADHSIDGYGGWQDQGDSSVQDDGATIYVRKNAWKSIDYDVTVTADTVLEFEFWSDKQGEVHGIGLDIDSQLSSSRTFKVYGTQDWGNTSYDNYSSSDGWKDYSIPIGQFYTGDFDKMVFVADHDSNPGNARSKFKNVRIYTP